MEELESNAESDCRKCMMCLALHQGDGDLCSGCASFGCSAQFYTNHHGTQNEQSRGPKIEKRRADGSDISTYSSSSDSPMNLRFSLNQAKRVFKNMPDEDRLTRYYSNLSLPDLHSVCQTRGIYRTSRQTKKELVAIIVARELGSRKSSISTTSEYVSKEQLVGGEDEHINDYHCGGGGIDCTGSGGAPYDFEFGDDVDGGDGGDFESDGSNDDDFGAKAGSIDIDGNDSDEEGFIRSVGMKHSAKPLEGSSSEGNAADASSSKKSEWRHRCAQKENWLHETYRRESAMNIALSSSPSTGGEVDSDSDASDSPSADCHRPRSPECALCDEIATIRCMDCARGGLFLCSRHDCHVTNLDRIHSTYSFSTLGYRFRLVSKRNWGHSSCMHCFASFKLDEEGTMKGAETVKTFGVVVITAENGAVEVDVNTLRCSNCDRCTGQTAAEFDCTPGSDNVWFENSLLRNHFNMFIASSFSLTQSARFRCLVLTESNKMRSKYSSTTALQLSYATRMFATKERDLRVANSTGISIINEECPACAQGIHALNVDGCRKTRVLKFNSSSAGPPLPGNGAFGDVVEIDGKFKDTLLEKFRRDVEETKSAASASVKEYKCSNLRAAVDNPGQRAKQFAVHGVYLGVCDHFTADAKTSRLMLTNGEKYELPHSIVAHYLHASNVRRRSAVFGETSYSSIPNFFISDLACKQWPYIEREEPELSDSTQMALGKLHGKTIVLSKTHNLT
jgi:hypothetical protein